MTHIYIYIWLVVWNMLFSIIYGMSSFPLTNSYFSSFFKMVIAPPSRHGEKNTDDCWITWDVFTNPIIDDEGESSPKLFQWEFQDPKMEVPTIYKAYIRPI